MKFACVPPIPPVYNVIPFTYVPHGNRNLLCANSTGKAEFICHNSESLSFVLIYFFYMILCVLPEVPLAACCFCKQFCFQCCFNSQNVSTCLITHESKWVELRIWLNKFKNNVIQSVSSFSDFIVAR